MDDYMSFKEFNQALDEDEIKCSLQLEENKDERTTENQEMV